MHSPSNNASQSGITLLEVLVVLFVCGILASMLLPALNSGDANRQRRSIRAKCQNNLRQMGLALKAYAEDHGGAFPFQVTSNATYQNERHAWVHFQAIASELGSPRVLVCPADRERVKNTPDNFHLGQTATATSLATRRDEGISYFVGLPDGDARPQDIVASDRNLAPNAELPAYSSRAAGGAIRIPVNSTWSTHKSNSLHQQQFGNVALADGSSVGTRDNSLQNLLRSAANSNGLYSIRLIFPQ